MTIQDPSVSNRIRTQNVPKSGLLDRKASETTTNAAKNRTHHTNTS